MKVPSGGTFFYVQFRYYSQGKQSVCRSVSNLILEKVNKFDIEILYKVYYSKTTYHKSHYPIKTSYAIRINAHETTHIRYSNIGTGGQMNEEKLNNRQLKDNTSKLIFGDAVLCAQFMRDFLDIPILKNIRPEDIEDVSQRYVPLFTSEREADTVKRVRLSDTESLFFITLIDHKTQVDYNVIMQLFRYMCYIWEDYEKEVVKKNGTKSTSKDFKYPPILPIVYYEGKNQWTAVTNFKDRVLLNDVFEKYIPDFSYELISLREYSSDRLIENQDEISLVMLLNKLQEAADLKGLSGLAKIGDKVWEKTPEYLLDIIAQITTALLYRINLPEKEVNEVVGQIKEKKMPVLFEHFEGYDIQATRKEARAEGREEGIKEGIKVLIETYNELGFSKDESFEKLKEKFALSDEEANQYFEQYWT